MGTIAQRASFDFVRYASVWEDADVLCRALATMAAGQKLLSIASAGDNTLALLTLDPAEVVAVDVSVPQLAALELRIAAFHCLDHAELLGFLGVTPSATRRETYQQLRAELGDAASGFWDARPAAVAGGIIHHGKFERYLRAFRRFLVPLVHGRGTIEALRRPRSVQERRRFYDERWDTWRWRALFRLFFSRLVMGRMGRDPEFFAEVNGSVASRLLARTRHALTALSVRENPYLAYIVEGTYPPEALPAYLRPANAATIRARLDRLRLVPGSVEEAAPEGFAGANLSDIFEYMSAAEHERCYAALVRRARQGARLIYWNLLVPRACPVALRERVRPLACLAASLHAGDRAWFYQELHIDEVVGDAVG